MAGQNKSFLRAGEIVIAAFNGPAVTFVDGQYDTEIRWVHNAQDRRRSFGAADQNHGTNIGAICTDIRCTARRRPRYCGLRD